MLPKPPFQYLLAGIMLLFTAASDDAWAQSVNVVVSGPVVRVPPPAPRPVVVVAPAPPPRVVVVPRPTTRVVVVAPAHEQRVYVPAGPPPRRFRGPGYGGGRGPGWKGGRGPGWKGGRGPGWKHH